MGNLLLQICFVAFIVLVAMGVDLISGLYKAKIRGEVHSSWGLKRTVQKFILYEGAILIAGCIDSLFIIAKVMHVIGLTILHGVAIFTAIAGIILCIVEIWSLREKADEKTRKDIDRASSILGNIIDKKELTTALSKAIADAIGNTAGKSATEESTN